MCRDDVKVKETERQKQGFIRLSKHNHSALCNQRIPLSVWWVCLHTAKTEASRVKNTKGFIRHQSKSSWLLPNMVHSPSKVASVVRIEAKCSVIVGRAGPGMKILHKIQFRMARRRGCADFLLTVDVCAQSRTLLVPRWAELGQTNFWATKQFPYSSRLFRMTQRRGRCSPCGRTPLNSTYFWLLPASCGKNL